MRAGVVRLLVEAQRGDVAVLVRAELHPDLDRLVVHGRARRRVGGLEDGARAGCRRAEGPDLVRREAVTEQIGDARRPRQDPGGVLLAERQRRQRRQRGRAGLVVVGDRGHHRRARVVLQRDRAVVHGARVERLVEGDRDLAGHRHPGGLRGGRRGRDLGRACVRRAGALEAGVDPVAGRVPGRVREAARPVAVHAVPSNGRVSGRVQRRSVDAQRHRAGAECEEPGARVVRDDVGRVAGDGDGEGSSCCCHPDAVSPVNSTSASRSPLADQTWPTWVPVLLSCL